MSQVLNREIDAVDKPIARVEPCRFEFLSGGMTVAGAFDFTTGQAYSSLRAQEPLEYTGAVSIFFDQAKQALFEHVDLKDGRMAKHDKASFARALQKLDDSRACNRA